MTKFTMNIKYTSEVGVFYFVKLYIMFLDYYFSTQQLIFTYYSFNALNAYKLFFNTGYFSILDFYIKKCSKTRREENIAVFV